MNVPKPIAIAGVNLRRLMRDRTGVFFVFIFPFLISLALGAAFGAGFDPTLGVVSNGSGVLGEDLRDRLEATENLRVRAFANEATLRTAIERNEVEAGVVIPADYDDRIRDGSAVALTYLARPTETSRELQVTLQAVVDQQSVRLRAARFAVEEGAMGSFGEALARAHLVAAAVPAIAVTSHAAGGDEEIGTFATGAAQELVLFVFLTSLSASGMLIETRRFGITRRMLASPTSVRSILVGEMLGRYAISVLQGVLIVGGTSVLFQVDWGNRLTTTAVVLLFALAATGAAMVMGSVLQNAAQAGAMGVFLGLVLAALGGCMVPLEVFPPVMNRIAHLIPHAWAIDALNATMASRAGPFQLLRELSVLAAYAAALLTGATLLLRRTLTARPG